MTVLEARVKDDAMKADTLFDFASFTDTISKKVLLALRRAKVMIVNDWIARGILAQSNAAFPIQRPRRFVCCNDRWRNFLPPKLSVKWA
jgi:predicted XRE-type DNA-binding protein